MRFYVDILGFESDKRTIEIFPTSNDWDLGFIDLYTLETSFNDIKFQCRYDEDLFTYYPTNNNEPFQLNTNMDHTTDEISLIGTRTLDDDELIWIENERIKINYEVSTNFYNVERGYNGSIAVSHFYTTDVNNISSIPIVTATIKRLSPIGLICKFYSTDNIGGNIKIYGYGQISGLTLSNNRLLNVSCKQLPKILDKTYLFTSINVDTYLDLIIFLSKDLSVSKHASNEFFRLLVIPDWFDFLFYVECKRVEEANCSTKMVKFKDIFEQLLRVNNSYVVFNSTTGYYNIQRLETNTSSNNEIISVFMSSYINIKDYKMEISPFQRVSTLSSRMKIISKDEDGLIVTNDKEISLKDDVISSVSDKSIDYDLSSLYLISENKAGIVRKKLRDKIYFLNQVYDELTISTTKWSRKFEIGKKYIFHDSHLVKSLVDKTTNTIWICLGYENLTCKFISIESFNRYLISPFRKLTHSTGDIWNVESLSLETSILINPYRSYETGDIVYVYTYKKSDQTITTTTKTLTLVTFASNYKLTISGLSTDSDYIHFITYNHNYLTAKYKLFLYEGNGLV